MDRFATRSQAVAARGGPAPARRSAPGRANEGQEGEVSDEPSKPRKPEPPWLGRLSRMGETAQRMQGKSRGTFGAASTVKMLMEWSCACGWQGTSRESQG